MKAPGTWILLMAVLAFAGLGWTQWQRRERTALERELAALKTAPPATTAAPQAAPVVVPSQTERGELLELRGRVAELVRRRMELAARGPAKVRTSAAGAAGSGSLHRRLGLPADYRLAGQLKFEGFQTPAAALASLIAGARALDTNLVLNAVTGDAATQPGELINEQRTGALVRDFGAVPGFRIVAEESDGPDRTLLQVELVPGQPPMPLLAVRRADGTWQLQP